MKERPFYFASFIASAFFVNPFVKEVKIMKLSKI
jgi:hypothetical protein